MLAPPKALPAKPHAHFPRLRPTDFERAAATLARIHNIQVLPCGHPLDIADLRFLLDESVGGAHRKAKFLVVTFCRGSAVGGCQRGAGHSNTAHSTAAKVPEARS